MKKDNAIFTKIEECAISVIREISDKVKLSFLLTDAIYNFLKESDLSYEY